jgi:hypothetical protein
MAKKKFESTESIPESIRLRRARQRRYKKRKGTEADVRFVGSFLSMRFVESLLIDKLGFLPPSADGYTDDELEIAYLALLAEWHSGLCPGYDEWRQATASLFRVRPVLCGTIGVVADAVVMSGPPRKLKQSTRRSA